MIHVCRALDISSQEEVTAEYFDSIPRALDNFYSSHPTKATLDKSILAEIIGRIGPKKNCVPCWINCCLTMMKTCVFLLLIAWNSVVWKIPHKFCPILKNTENPPIWKCVRRLPVWSVICNVLKNIKKSFPG